MTPADTTPDVPDVPDAPDAHDTAGTARAAGHRRRRVPLRGEDDRERVPVLPLERGELGEPAGRDRVEDP
ncbi:hypothetical protein CXF36_09885, partial [Corynebacterium bovis]